MRSLPHNPAEPEAQLRRDSEKRYAEPCMVRRAAPRYLTLFIHLSTGPLTEVSGEPGEKTSDMWLWSLNTATVG